MVMKSESDPIWNLTSYILLFLWLICLFTFFVVFFKKTDWSKKILRYRKTLLKNQSLIQINIFLVLFWCLIIHGSYPIAITIRTQEISIKMKFSILSVKVGMILLMILTKDLCHFLDLDLAGFITWSKGMPLENLPMLILGIQCLSKMCWLVLSPFWVVWLHYLVFWPYMAIWVWLSVNFNVITSCLYLDLEHGWL